MNRSDAHRVVVTGTGCVSVLGEEPAAMLEGLLAGRSGITRWKRQPGTLYSKIGGDLTNFDVRRHFSTWPREIAGRAQVVLRTVAPAGQMVAASVFQALNEAGAIDLCDKAMAHIAGTHNTNEQFMFDQALQYATEPEYVDSNYTIVGSDIDVMSPSNELFRIGGPSFTVGGACASSNVALIVALDLLRAGRAKRAVVSGAAMTISPLALQGWAFIEALSLDTFIDEPQRASRPFDIRREGFVPSEGAGAVVLETLCEARLRGAPVLAEIAGGAITSAACRGTRTDVEAQKRAICGALQDAEISAAAIDYVNAHGTSTPVGDLNEMEALRQALGSYAGRPLVNSSKAMLGHALQAASILELIATVGQMRAGVIHATVNLDEVDPAFRDFKFVGDFPREATVNVAVSNAFGFGGVNAVVVVRRL